MFKNKKIIDKLEKNIKFSKVVVAFFENYKRITKVAKETNISRKTIYDYLKEIDEYIINKDVFHNRIKITIKNKFIYDYFVNKLKEANNPLTEKEEEIFLEILEQPFFNEYLRSQDDTLFKDYSKLVNPFFKIVDKIHTFFLNISIEKRKTPHRFNGVLEFHSYKLHTEKKEMKLKKLKEIEEQYNSMIDKISSQMANKFILLHPVAIDGNVLFLLLEHKYDKITIPKRSISSI